MKVAIVIESSSRMDSAQAYEFYTGNRSRWIKAALEYMQEVQFPTEHIYFLSFHELRIIPYGEVIKDYPIHPAPDKKMQKIFAERIFSFITEKYDGAEVQIHAGKSITEFLVPLLKQSRTPYVVFAEGEQLLKKAIVYGELIQQERALKRMRDMKREKEKIISIPEFFTPQEADKIVTEYSSVAHKYGVEKIFSEIKLLLREYKQQLRQAQVAREEFEKSLEDHERKELQDIIEKVHGLSDLFSNELAEFRKKNGRAISKLATQLIKDRFVMNTINRISEAMFRLQIVLYKG